ncbi:19066_t:CDS:2 [Cetraspora pellucida]|uniref:19066_t:CDS:1 n=1 Tax=Cetraspora pellucida TaxID=1433469 RepID=A0A9N9P9D8_9GLOM|nr:19066_t:CDS:2 [Cetraspora pellucida]
MDRRVIKKKASFPLFLSFLRGDMSVEIPTQIKKTLAALKSQMEKADLEGTCLVSNNNIIYFTEQQSQVVEVPNLKRESDAQRLHSRMPEFLEDLHQREITPRSPYHISQLSYYYFLGTLMEEKAWNKEARNVVKRLFPHNHSDILIIAQRTHLLYRLQGPSHLFLSQSITPFVLRHLLKEDFATLQTEAQLQVQQEIDEVLALTCFTGAQ